MERDGHMTKEQKKEFAARVVQANRSQLVVINYEVILLCIENAFAAVNECDRQQVKEEIKLARQFVNQLMSSLDFSHKISFVLMKAYICVDKQLVRAQSEMSQECLAEAKSIIKDLHQSFMEIASKDHSLPLMENSETIYCGLTYGKNELNEISEPGSERRGYRV